MTTVEVGPRENLHYLLYNSFVQLDDRRKREVKGEVKRSREVVGSGKLCKSLLSKLKCILVFAVDQSAGKYGPSQSKPKLQLGNKWESGIALRISSVIAVQ